MLLKHHINQVQQHLYSSIGVVNTIFFLNVDLPQTSCVGDETHETLSDIFDFIIFMKQTDMLPNCCMWIIPGGSFGFYLGM